MLNLLWASAAAFFRGVCDVLSLHRVLLLVLKSGKESAVVRQRIVRTSAPTCRLGYLRGLQIANFSFEVWTLNFRIIIVGHDLWSFILFYYDNEWAPEFRSGEELKLAAVQAAATRSNASCWMVSFSSGASSSWRVALADLSPDRLRIIELCLFSVSKIGKIGWSIFENFDNDYTSAIWFQKIYLDIFFILVQNYVLLNQ